jgi:16S rRNA (uracil1498-N3)-methyltransferase
MRDFRHFLFFTEHIEAGRLYLAASETRHAAAVLRRRPGDPFLATDGQGTVFECRVESIDKKHIAGLIMDHRVVPRHTFRIRLFAGVPERPAFESLIGDLTALGVERITPLVCRHCQGAWWERGAGGERLSERLRTKMIAAMKQSLYPYLPQLDPPLPFGNIASSVSGICLAADPEGVHVSDALSGRPQGAVVACVVGPPGGFAPEEEAALKVLGVAGVRLTPTRLTTELAAVVLCGQVIGAQRTDAPFPQFPGPAA